MSFIIVIISTIIFQRIANTLFDFYLIDGINFTMRVLLVESL